MKKSLTALMIILFGAIMAGCGGGGDNSAVESGENKWLPFDKGIALAKSEKKPIVIDFYTDWCRWCKVMDKQTFSKPEISSFLAEHFVSVRINAESMSEKFKYQGKEYTPVELTRKFRIRGYPSIVYLDEEGTLIKVVPGYQPPEKYLPWLTYIQKGCYKKKISFEEYRKRKGDCS